MKHNFNSMTKEQFLSIRETLEAGSTEQYIFDRHYHRAHPAERIREQAEARSREFEYARSLPQPSEDERKLAAIKEQRNGWRKRGRPTEALDKLIDEIEAKQVADQARAKFINSEEFKNIEAWTKSYTDTMGVESRHEVELRLNALKDHGDFKRYNVEVLPFINDEMKRRDNEYLDAHQANLKLQRDAAKSAADQIERDMNRELGDAK